MRLFCSFKAFMKQWLTKHHKSPYGAAKTNGLHPYVRRHEPLQTPGLQQQDDFYKLPVVFDNSKLNLIGRYSYIVV